jgi:hypothetical protein
MVISGNILSHLSAI